MCACGLNTLFFYATTEAVKTTTETFLRLNGGFRREWKMLHPFPLKKPIDVNVSFLRPNA